MKAPLSYLNGEPYCPAVVRHKSDGGVPSEDSAALFTRCSTDVFIEIVRHVDHKTVEALSAACKKFHQIVQHNAKAICKIFLINVGYSCNHEISDLSNYKNFSQSTFQLLEAMQRQIYKNSENKIWPHLCQILPLFDEVSKSCDPLFINGFIESFHTLVIWNKLMGPSDCSVEWSFILPIYIRSANLEHFLEFSDKVDSIGFANLMSVNCDIEKTAQFKSFWDEAHKCKSFEQTTLNFFNSSLWRLPKTLTLLTQLETLCLIKTFVQELPEWISQLKNLQTLYLHHCELKSLPTQIGGLCNLVSLCLDSNKLTQLPTEIGLLSSLVSFSVRDNLLDGLPKELGALKNLEEFYCAGNRISYKKIPPEIMVFKHLSSDFAHLSI